MSVDVLVVAAFPPELRAIAKRFVGESAGEISGVRVAWAAVGIGLVDSAIGAYASIVEWSPAKVVLVGTCGVYPGAPHRIGDAIVGREVRLVEPAMAEGRAATPAPMARVLTPDEAMTSELASRTSPVAIATTVAITTDDDLARRVGEHEGCAVEHLEAFGVARACASRGVPIAVVLGVANTVGSAARAEWLAHHGAAGDRAVSAVIAWIEEIGLRQRQP